MHLLIVFEVVKVCGFVLGQSCMIPAIQAARGYGRKHGKCAVAHDVVCCSGKFVSHLRSHLLRVALEDGLFLDVSPAEVTGLDLCGEIR